MAHWTDKDSFRLVHYTADTYYHVIRPGVLNDLRQYNSSGEVLTIRTNGEVITSWCSNDYMNAQPMSRVLLAEMIKSTKPSETLPVLVASIPDLDKVDIGMVVWCWMRLSSANAMQLARYDGMWSASTFSVPASDKDPVCGFSTNSPIKQIGTPRIYYDWREALAPITDYFKAVIKYCKDTGKARRLEIEAASQALNDRNGTIRTVVSKNDKRFKDISF